MRVDAKSHYDHVTDSWKEFMGDNFHFGYFPTEDTELSRATDIMIEKMAGLCDISRDTRILDVGCGIGTPAFYLHEKYGCPIEGISTSERGIKLANEGAEQKGFQDVRFRVADGMDNGFPDRSFDLVWIMEAAHLILDKKKLFRECHRVLKDEGTLVMCDLVQHKLLSLPRGLAFFFTHMKKYYRLLRAFGPGQLPTMGNYADAMVHAGFRDINILDITPHVLPTARRWRENAVRVRDEGEGAFPREDVETFIAGCEILDEFFRMGLFGYTIIRAKK
ncbi:MAG: methyltransferase domain-containing protein [Actinobacteria bacterium]|nr:methyltransferase domain-containing protein [Actinomycetota bacterium]